MRPNKKSLLAQCANNLRKTNSVPRVPCMRMSAREESMSFVCFLVSSQLFAGVCDVRVCVCFVLLSFRFYNQRYGVNLHI